MSVLPRSSSGPLLGASSRPPDAASPGRLCIGRQTPRPQHRLPSLWAGSDHLRRPHCRYRPSAHDSTRKPCASLRVAQIIATILRAVPSYHEARQRNCHASCGPPPGGCLLDLCSASVGTPGRLRVGQVGWCRLAGARPRSIGAVPGKERERCSLSARRCAPVLR